MLRALGRKALADLRGQRLQGLAILTIVAAASATLVLALTLRASTSDPWERVFAETNGAHVNLYVRMGTDVTPVLRLDGIAETAGPFPTLWDQRVVHGLDKEELALFGLPAEPPAVERPRVTDGRWLNAGGEREVVLDRSTAQALDLGVGDTIELLTPHGKEGLQVVGLAVTGNWGAYPDWDPGLAYVLPATLSLIEPDQDTWAAMLAVRLTDPEATEAFVDRAMAVLPENAVTGDTTWQEIRENLDFNNAIFVVLLGTFSLLALVAAGLVIANAIGGRVLAQGREIGLLKAIGFTPRGVALLFLVEHLVLGLVGALFGVGIGLLLAPRLLARAADVLDTTASPSFQPVATALVVAGVLALVVLFTLLPAWQAGRIPTVRAIATGIGGPASGRSRLASLAARLRLPPVVVLGAKDAFAHRLRAWVTVAALALTVVCAVATLGVEATTRQLLEDPSGTGGALGMLVNRGDVPEARARQILTAHPETLAVMTILDEDAEAVSGAERLEFDVRAVGGDYERFLPRVLEGRSFAAAGEAIAGRGLLDLLGLEIGDTVQFTVEGRPLTVTVVGRYLEMDNDGRVLTFGFDTLHEQIDPAIEPDSYGLMLAAGTDREALKAALVRASDDQFEVIVVSGEGFAEDVNQFRVVLAGLAGALLLLGLGNLLTTALLGVRERQRDIGVLKALGCTPRQVVASVVVGVGLLAVVGVAIGVPLGLAATRALLDYAGRETGFGLEFGKMPPWTWLLALAPAAILLAILAGTIPARRAAALRVTEALRAE
jgi:putative ABC transport system permease protein